MPLFVVERKTTAEDISEGSDYWKRLHLDPQVSTYIEAGITEGLDIVGCLYDVLHKPANRPMETRNESPEAFEKRILACISQKPSYYYRRGIIVRLEGERVEHARDRWQTAISIQTSRRLRTWPRNPDACMQWHRLCDYFPICTGVARQDDGLLFQVGKPHEELGSSDPDLLTQSSLRTYRSCPRKYQFRYEIGLRSTKQKTQALRTGTSVHAALETLSKTGGDLSAALASLGDDNPFELARQRAMVIGYHVQWQEDLLKVVGVEHEFRIALVNPETGAASRMFRIGGKIDVIAEVVS
jgi:hypothetical protein